MKLCCTESALEFLKKEGISQNAYVVGDPMYDAFKYYSEKVGDDVPEKLVGFDGEMIELPQEFYYMTCHREENTGTDEALMEILDAMETLDKKCIYPVHPRNQERAERLIKDREYENIILCEPVGYLMSVYLVNHCQKVVTDSGGLQREAFFAEKQCITVFSYVAWPETMIDNRNQLAKANKKDILEKLAERQEIKENDAFGDGQSAVKIIKRIDEYIGRNKE